MIEDPKVGNKVLILHPAYVAGKIGVVVGKEDPSDGELNDRWLIRVDSESKDENILVSLNPKEFQVF
ncbi:MAG: hypothetical protein SAK29_35015 [Scytonema sp. PMC 1069.18]|nr:hypothetical protein [Scytonema sp. PMC 1069.18]MEC4887266.1 hypothetical protein [Scytonema sp. PMC 1070.18]